jgi:beta-CASP RNase J family ribonuclease
VPALDPSTPIYAGWFTMQLIRRRMMEFSLWNDERFKVFEMNERFQAGPFDMEAVRVTHSIPDCCGLIFRCDAGTIVHTGDWKIDENPVDGRVFDRESWERVGNEGVTLMMSDSTNVLSPGRTVSESAVSEGIMRRVLGHRGRIITTQFASNIHRLYGVRDAAEATGRQIAFLGLSLTTYLEAAKKAGIAPIDPEKLIPADEIDNCDPSKLLIVTTGSQGEDRAQLAQAAFGSSRLLTLQPEDLLLYSAKMIPGNEKRVMRMMNEIAKRGPEIAMSREDCLHSSGHGYKDELDEVIKLVKPEHFLPVHGEYAFLRAHEQLARQSGVMHTTVIGNGEMLGVTPLASKRQHGTMGNFHRIGKARLQTMFNDGGFGSGTAEDLAIEERMRIAVEGIIVCDYEITNNGDNLISAKARVTSRGMWTDDGRLLESVRSSAIAATDQMTVDTKLSTIERTVSRAIRTAVKNYCNKRPDVIVVAHRAGERSRPIPDLDAMEEEDSPDGTQKRYPRRNTAPTDVRPLRGDYKGPGPSGSTRHLRRDAEYQ